MRSTSGPMATVHHPPGRAQAPPADFFWGFNMANQELLEERDRWRQEARRATERAKRCERYGKRHEAAEMRERAAEMREREAAVEARRILDRFGGNRSAALDWAYLQIPRERRRGGKQRTGLTFRRHERAVEILADTSIQLVAPTSPTSPTPPTSILVKNPDRGGIQVPPPS